jgi:short-chain fatty acids transporter
MNWTDRIEKVFRTLLPTPFAIAIILTLITFLLGLLFGEHGNSNPLIHTATEWERNLWNGPLLIFAMQMMLMLVLGHVLALSPLADRIIRIALRYCNSTASSAYVVSLLAVIVGLFNWGLGLIFGAIFARKVADRALEKGLRINFPIIGAAGYASLAVWHGGLSGSSTVKVAEEGHLTQLMSASASPELMEWLPSRIGFEETVFSTMNLSVIVALLIILPASLYMLGKKVQPSLIKVPSRYRSEESHVPYGAEKLDYSSWFSKGIGILLIILLLYKVFVQTEGRVLDFFNPNNINYALLSLGVLLHRNLMGFLEAVDDAIGGVAGILIQFPLYFGIMGIMQSTGLVEWMSDFFVRISSATTYPLFTFLSAGIVNIFVPSGGGQWAVQGAIIIQAAYELDISLSKCIMAMAYGDELTNMLQPFWALPLLGITGLKAKEILPYTFFILVICGAIFTSALLIFR